MRGGEDREGGGLKGVGEVVLGEVDGNEGGGDERHRQDNRSGIKAEKDLCFTLWVNGVTHWFPSLSTPCSFLNNANLLTVIPQINTSSAGDATFAQRASEQRGSGWHFSGKLTTARISSLLPSTPEESPPPLPKVSMRCSACWLSSGSPVINLLPLSKPGGPCLPENTPSSGRHGWLKRGELEGLGEREKGDFNPHFLVSTQNLILPLD